MEQLASPSMTCEALGLLGAAAAYLLLNARQWHSVHVYLASIPLTTLAASGDGSIPRRAITGLTFASCRGSCVANLIAPNRG